MAKNSQCLHGVIFGSLQFECSSATMGTRYCEPTYWKLWATVQRIRSKQKSYSNMTPCSLCTEVPLTEITYAKVCMYNTQKGNLTSVKKKSEALHKWQLTFFASCNWMLCSQLVGPYSSPKPFCFALQCFFLTGVLFRTKCSIFSSPVQYCINITYTLHFPAVLTSALFGLLVLGVIALELVLASLLLIVVVAPSADVFLGLLGWHRKCWIDVWDTMRTWGTSMPVWWEAGHESRCCHWPLVGIVCFLSLAIGGQVSPSNSGNISGGWRLPRGRALQRSLCPVQCPWRGHGSQWTGSRRNSPLPLLLLGFVAASVLL